MVTKNNSPVAPVIVVIALIALTAVIVWWTGGGDAAAPTDGGVAEVGVASEEAGPGIGSTGTGPPGRAVRERVGAVSAVSGLAEAGASQITIQVVDASGEALVGAEVGWHVERDGEDYGRGTADRERLAFAGEVERSDERGQVRIPVEEALSWTVYGRGEERFGVKFVPIAEVGQVHELKLVRDITIRAKVVDPSGRPVVGVRVGLVDEAGIETFSVRVLQETVGPDGIATFHHVQQSLLPDWGGECAVMIGCPVGEPVFARVDTAAVSEDPYLLQLPGTGSIHIALVGSDQLPVRGLTDRVFAKLYELLPNGERRFWLPFDGARLDLDHVGLGLRFRLELSSPGVSGMLEFAGPKEWGERIEQRLVVTRNPTLSGRLVDEGGVPQEGYWYATHVQPERGHYNQYFETGVDGLFHAAVPDLPGESVARGVIFQRTIANREQQAFVDLAALELRDGRNELGDVTLIQAPVLTAGRIVDDAGKPVVGANVMVLQGDPDNEVWKIGGLGNMEDVSASDGTFVIRAHHMGSGLLLYAEQGSVHGEMMPIAPGTTGVDYLMPRVGSASMRLAFEDGLTAKDLLFCHLNRATGVTKSVVSHYAVEGETAHWRGLRPGRYDFSIRMVGSPEPLVVVPGIDIAGAEDAELPAQQLGGEVHSLAVRILDDEGQPIERASLVIDPEAFGDHPRTALGAKLGERKILVPKVPIDLVIIAPGYRTQVVRGVAGDITVRMQAGLLVELVVNLPSGFPAAAQQLQPFIRHYDRADPDPNPWAAGHELYLRGAGRMWYPKQHSWLWAPQVRLDRSGRVSFRVPAAGDYEIEWSLRGDGSRELPESARRVFSVSESEVATRVEVSLTEADVR